MKIVKAVQSIIGSGPHLLHEPLFIGNEAKYVNEVLASGHLAAGKKVDEFERRFALRINARHAIAVVNATSGLHAAITAMPKKEEYRIPSLTFVATANAVSYGNNKIRFVEHDGYCDIAVDRLGHPHFCLSAAIKDAAQSLGTKWHGNYTGSQGTCIFSFAQNKIITTGFGGMVTTDDAEIAKRIRQLVTTARVQHKWETAHDAVAFNYRMSDLSAAVGLGQLEQLTTILKAKRALAKKYIEVFSNFPGVKPIIEPAHAESNYWLNAISLDDASQMEPVLEELHAAGIMARRVWTPIHLLPMYQDCAKNDLSRTEDYFSRVIFLPSSPKLGLKYA